MPPEPQKQEAKQEKSVADIVREMLPTIVAAVQMGAQTAPSNGAPRQRAMPDYPNCELCGQFIHMVKDKDGKDVADPKVGCGGEHELMVVFPKTAAAQRSFQFAAINGRRYTSANASHRVYVPKRAIGEIQRQVDLHEQNEEELQQGRKGGSRANLAYNGGATNSNDAAQNLGAGWRM